MAAMAGPFAPSGRQIRITGSGQELVAVEVGGGIRSYRSGDLHVLDGYAETAICSGARGQLLSPWPNRVGDGRWEWEGATYQLALTEPEHSNAIHGLVRWLPWSLVELDEGAGDGSTLRLGCRLYPQPGWPWLLDLSVRYDLGVDGLTVTTSVTNGGGPGACPIGLGWHPYIAAFGGAVDELDLLVPAGVSYVSDERGLPVSKGPVDGTDDDFRVAQRIGRAKLDVAFTEFERDVTGRAMVEIRHPSGQGTRLWMDDNFTHVMVYTGDTLAEPDRRRRGLAVEPMTCAPDMLRNRDGMVLLPEGIPFEAAWGLEIFKI
jgi:aldose 1-epimerase